MSTSGSAQPALSGFIHAALIVNSDNELADALVPYLRRSLDDGDRVTMVVGEHIARVVSHEMGDLSEGLDWADPTAFYQRLGFAFEGFRQYLATQHAAGRRVHVVAEPDITTELGAGTTVDRVAAYLPYESMANDAYAEFDCPVTCIWDGRRHPALVVEAVRSLHSRELTPTGSVANPHYVPPEVYLAGRSAVPLEPPVPGDVDVDLSLTDLEQLGFLRDELREWAAAHRFSDLAVQDVVVAVTEVATNGLVHGEPPVHTRAWRWARTLVVQVDDVGGRAIPPVAGYRRPSASADQGGRGMWLARQLADTLDAYTGNGVTSVRLHFPHDVMHRNELADPPP